MLKRLRFHYKLFISFSIFVFAVLTISGSIFYFYTYSIIEKNVAENQKQTTQKAQEQLDNMLSEMDKITIAVNSSAYIMDVLKKIPENPDENYFDKNPRISDSIKNVLYSYISPNPIKGRISIISKHYDYTELTNQFDNQEITKEYIEKIPRIEKFMKSDNYKFFVQPHNDDWSAADNKVITVSRPIRDNFNVYGIVEVSRKVSDIDNLFNYKDTNKKINIAIFNESEELIYDNFDSNESFDKGLLYDKKISESSFGSFIAHRGKNSTDLIASFSRLSNVNWTVVQYEDMASFKKPVRTLNNIIITTYLLLFIGLVAVLYIFTGGITKPIEKLNELVLETDVESLELNFYPNENENEINVLGDAFQKLLLKIKDSREKILIANSRETKARMLAFQSQMNPHFLYNTLAVIGAYGQQKGNNEVSQMCGDLSKMLRYTIDLNDKDTKLISEIDHVESYLKLMSRRYDGFVKYSINVDKELDNINVPRLILEPIVENAFIHGFKDIDPIWKVDISGFIKEGKWHIEVRDNGKGFSKEAYDKLKEKFDKSRNCISNEMLAEDIGKNGYGLVNTLMRLNIFYSGNEIVEFYNSPGGGAVVVLGGSIN